MKKTSAIVFIVVLVVTAVSTGAFAQGTKLVPATPFPYEIMGENYVPSLYFSEEQIGDERLVAAPDFPYETLDLCYSPSLYYEAWKIRAVQAMK